MNGIVHVISGEARIATRVDGAAHLPWLVLSNSLATDMSLWADQIPLLTHSHRVLRYDTRGHGESSAPAGPYDFPMLVADVIAVMDHYGVKRADLMGLSLGGMTMLGVGLDHPQRVNRIVCADARADNPPPFVAGWDQRIEAVREKGMQGILSGTLDRWFTTANRERRPELAERASAMILATAPEGYIGCAQALKTLDYLRRLPELRAPALFIGGVEDVAAPAEAMRAMAKAAPQGRYESIPEAAHIANMEQPAAFDGLVGAFLREEESRAAG